MGPKSDVQGHQWVSCAGWVEGRPGPLEGLYSEVQCIKGNGHKGVPCLMSRRGGGAGGLMSNVHDVEGLPGTMEPVQRDSIHLE